MTHSSASGRRLKFDLRVDEIGGTLTRLWLHGGCAVMVGILGRLLIISDQRDFACLIGSIGERQRFSARILPHALDLQYMLDHWRPDAMVVQMPMQDDQDVEVLEHLERSRYKGPLLLIGDVSKSALEQAAEVARRHGLEVLSVVTKRTPVDRIERTLEALLRLERAA